MTEQGYLIEFRPMGPVVKVSAIDPATGLEVSIVGSSKATQSELTDLAIQKLKYVQERQRAEKESQSR